MRAIVVCCALVAGCGRLGFDARTATDASTTDTGSTVPSCTATKISGLSMPAGITDLAAATLNDGYAIGGLQGMSGLYGIHLDTTLAPNNATPFQTSPIPFTAYSYTGANLWFDGTNLDGAVWMSDGTMFLKTYRTDMTQFLTATVKTARHGEPSVAHAGTMTMSFWFTPTALEYSVLLADGQPDVTDRIAHSVGNLVSASTASGPAAATVYAMTDGSCELCVTADDFTAQTRPFAPSCTNPYVHRNNVDLVSVYETSGMIATRDITVSGSPITSGVTAERLLVAGGNPRLIQTDRRWLVWTDSTRLHLGPLDTISDATISGLPAGVPDAFETTGSYVFAVWGTDLYAITCP